MQVVFQRSTDLLLHTENQIHGARARSPSRQSFIAEALVQFQSGCCRNLVKKNVILEQVYSELFGLSLSVKFH